MGSILTIQYLLARRILDQSEYLTRRLRTELYPLLIQQLQKLTITKQDFNTIQ